MFICIIVSAALFLTLSSAQDRISIKILYAAASDDEVGGEVLWVLGSDQSYGGGCCPHLQYAEC